MNSKLNDDALSYIIKGIMTFFFQRHISPFLPFCIIVWIIVYFITIRPILKKHKELGSFDILAVILASSLTIITVAFQIVQILMYLNGGKPLLQ